MRRTDFYKVKFSVYKNRNKVIQTITIGKCCHLCYSCDTARQLYGDATTKGKAGNNPKTGSNTTVLPGPVGGGMPLSSSHLRTVLHSQL